MTRLPLRGRTKPEHRSRPSDPPLFEDPFLASLFSATAAPDPQEDEAPADPRPSVELERPALDPLPTPARATRPSARAQHEAPALPAPIGHEAERSLSSRRIGVSHLRAATEQGGEVSTPMRLDIEALLALEAAGVSEVEVLVDAGSELGTMESRAAQPQAGRMLAEVLGANRRTLDPVTRANDPHVGRRAAAAVEAAVDTLAWSAPTAELLLNFGLQAGFLGPAGETALMGAVVGATLGWDGDRLAAMALCGLLADVGMLKLPRDVVHKPGVLSPSERRRLETHPQLGRRLLQPLVEELTPLAPLVALQHHERVDGQGYPNRLSGDTILPEAQIVAVCHLFLAGVSGRQYRSALSPRRALALIEQMAGTACDPEIARAFLTGVAVHPIGALARLSSGECGRVVAGGTPRRPRVEVLWALDGSEIEPRVVDTDPSGEGLQIVAVAD